jgi:hypothetical protein
LRAGIRLGDSSRILLLNFKGEWYVGQNHQW